VDAVLAEIDIDLRQKLGVLTHELFDVPPPMPQSVGEVALKCSFVSAQNGGSSSHSC
jgi:hypothetical protein